jgi:hypothetical protein
MITRECVDILLEISEKGIYLEGALLKVVIRGNTLDDSDWIEYLKVASSRDEIKSSERVELTQEALNQKSELERAHKKIKQQYELLKKEKAKVEDDVCTLEKNLKVLREKNQLKLMNNVVNICLRIIIGIGLSCSIILVVMILFGKQSDLVESTWSQSILLMLSNSFSIIATIQGVKSIKDN